MFELMMWIGGGALVGVGAVVVAVVASGRRPKREGKSLAEMWGEE